MYANTVNNMDIGVSYSVAMTRTKGDREMNVKRDFLQWLGKGSCMLKGTLIHK